MEESKDIIEEESEDIIEEESEDIPYIIPGAQCENQLNWEDIIGKKQLVKNNWRFFIITTGAPGTGKSTSTETLKYYAGNIIRQRDKKDWVSISHDAYVEKTKEYDTIIKKYNTKKTRAKKKEMRDILEKTYNKTRRGRATSLNSQKFINNLWKSQANLSEINQIAVNDFGTRILAYKDIIDGVKSKKNIIYETTGEKWETVLNTFKQIENSHCGKKDSPRYIVLLSYNFINIKKNIQNLIVRWQQSVESYRKIKSEVKKYSFKSKKSKLKPFLSPIFEESEEYEDDDVSLGESKKAGDEKPRNWIGLERERRLKNIAIKVRENISKLVANCYDDKLGKGTCPGIGPDIIFIFNRSAKFDIKPIILPLTERGTILNTWSRQKTVGQTKNNLKDGRKALEFLKSEIKDLHYFSNGAKIELNKEEGKDGYGKKTKKKKKKKKRKTKSYKKKK